METTKTAEQTAEQAENRRTWEDFIRGQMEEGRQAAQALCSVVNRYDDTAAEAFVGEVLNFHRTNQQSTMRLLVKLFEAWRDQYNAGRYDARNVNTLRLAAHFTELVEEIEPRLGMV